MPIEKRYLANEMKPEYQLGQAEKSSQYRSLVKKRTNCRICPSLKNPSECPEFDTEGVGPWSAWQGDLDAKILLIGQDWGDYQSYIHSMGRDEDINLTNQHIMQLFSSIGFPIEGPSAELSSSKLFFTNAVLCLKEGGLSAPIPKRCYNNCGTRILRSLIDIISPRVIIALGKSAYEQVVQLYDLEILPFREAVDIENGIHIGKNKRLFPVYHCGAYGWNINRKGQQINDWQKIRRYLDTISSG